MNKRFSGTVLGLLVSSVLALGVLLPAAPASAHSGTSGKGCTAYSYSRGSSSACVGYIQRMLNGITANYAGKGGYTGYGLTVGNSFGANTDTVVRRFQGWTWFGALTKDGIVGPKTWDKLCFLAGQVEFSSAWPHATKNAAWTAAYNAGCIVERWTGSTYVSISRY